MEKESERGKRMGRGELKEEVMDKIAERLSSLDNLYFPQAVVAEASTPSLRKTLLLDLIRRDIPLFLERYGLQMTPEELEELDVLKEDDYEIDWHLKHLRSKMSPSSEQLRFRSLTKKNRRRAYMGKLINQGHYFSEDAMRERQPYLHHQYVGKFQDPYGRRMARPGERWSDTLMRRAEEAILLTKIRAEQQRLGVDQSEWVGNEIPNTMEEQQQEEEDDDDDDDDDKPNASGARLAQVQNGATNGIASGSGVNIERPMLSPAEMQEQVDQFTYIMQQRFLSGQDHEYINYSKIDEDETLDDHWSKEANCDAEEKYFEED